MQRLLYLFIKENFIKLTKFTLKQVNMLFNENIVDKLRLVETKILIYKITVNFIVCIRLLQCICISKFKYLSGLF